KTKPRKNENSEETSKEDKKKKDVITESPIESDIKVSKTMVSAEDPISNNTHIEENNEPLNYWVKPNKPRESRKYFAENWLEIKENDIDEENIDSKNEDNIDSKNEDIYISNEDTSLDQIEEYTKITE